jgi:TctA family transporter
MRKKIILIHTIEWEKKEIVEVISVSLSSIVGLFLFIIAIQEFDFTSLIGGTFSILPLFYSIYFGFIGKYFKLENSNTSTTSTVDLDVFPNSMRKPILKVFEEEGIIG